MDMEKTMQWVVGASTLLLLALTSMPVHAAGAHVHGVATLQVAVDANRLTLDFYSPLDNLVGFEHAPRNDKQRAAVRRMVEQLHKPELTFVPTAEANCTRNSVNLESPAIPRSLLAADGLAQPTAPEPSGRGPEKSSKKGAKDQHAGLSAEIVFRCERPEKLSGLEVKMFDAFPKLTRVDAQVVTARKQAAAKLTTRNRRVTW